jgi:prepilin-type N-terminal cleavage/methylation domain-containing protein
MKPPSSSGVGRRRHPQRRSRRAFTLIEIMLVVGIMALIVSMGIPSIYRMWNKEGMRKAVEDITDVCVNARARAILTGAPAEIVFHPLEKRFEVSGGGDSPTALSGKNMSGQFGNDINIEMLDINLLEYKESELARVRFFPNGTSDEMALSLQPSRNEWRKVSLEITTALATAEPVQR